MLSVVQWVAENYFSYQNLLYPGLLGIRWILQQCFVFIIILGNWFLKVCFMRLNVFFSVWKNAVAGFRNVDSKLLVFIYSEEFFLTNWLLKKAPYGKFQAFSYKNILTPWFVPAIRWPTLFHPHPQLTLQPPAPGVLWSKSWTVWYFVWIFLWVFLKNKESKTKYEVIIIHV